VRDRPSTGSNRWVTWRRRARRLPRSLLLLALVVVLLPLWLMLPTSRAVQLTLRDPTTLTRLEVAWLEADGRVPLKRTTHQFQRGRAPATITTEVRAMRGSYLLEVYTERGSERRHEEHPVRIGLVAPELDIVVQ